jgi:hypothetical protein
MKKISLFVFGVLLMLLLPSAVSALGNIAVSSSPPGAQIFVDSFDKGVTPMTVDNVTIGHHNVLLIKAGYMNHLSSVTVGDGETVTVSVTLTTTASTPIISNITPSSASNSGLHTIVIAGKNFSGSTVSLTQSGQSTMVGAVVGTDTSTTLIRNFHLDGIASGTWNVEILNVDGGTVTGTFIVNSAKTETITSFSPTEVTVTTTVPTTTVTTVKTTVKSTVKVPTPWPSSTATPARASPVGVIVILGAVGVGFIVIRKM